MSPSGSRAVSYTHLDVYKRQVDTRELTRIIREHGVMNAAICSGIPADLTPVKTYAVTGVVEAVTCRESSIPVSYTHLDVYKRQELRYARALRGQTEEQFPDLSPEALAAAYPGRNQSLTQVLSTADARLSGMTEKA